MNDLVERYIACVCQYFHGLQRIKVYLSLKNDIAYSSYRYRNIEEQLLSFGHPLSVAYTYGYRPIINRRFHHHLIETFEVIVYLISHVLFILSSIYYLHLFDCFPMIPFTPSQINMPIMFFLTHFFLCMFVFAFTLFLVFLLIEYRYKSQETFTFTFTKKELHALAHPSHYPRHYIETFLIIIFILFFVLYFLFFISTKKSYILNLSCFLQLFIFLIILEYIIDFTKKTYRLRDLVYSTITYFYILISITLFIIGRSFFKNDLFPINHNNLNLITNIFIISAFFLIYSISIYKLIKNIKNYYFLFK